VFLAVIKPNDFDETSFLRRLSIFIPKMLSLFTL